jgi:hypothetical protein
MIFPAVKSSSVKNHIKRTVGSAQATAIRPWGWHGRIALSYHQDFRRHEDFDLIRKSG